MIESLDTEVELDLDALQVRLERAFVARFGLDVGRDVASETIAWALEHRAALADVDNVAGYLFRVGQSKSRRFLRWKNERARFPAEAAARSANSSFEPALPDALAELSDEQRTAIVLVHCFQWTYAEVAEVTDQPLHTVRNLIHRGMKQLRSELGVER